MRQLLCCVSELFNCTNGETIPILQRCDGMVQCQNAHDEHDCPESNSKTLVIVFVQKRNLFCMRQSHPSIHSSISKFILGCSPCHIGWGWQTPYMLRKSNMTYHNASNVHIISKQFVMWCFTFFVFITCMSYSILMWFCFHYLLWLYQQFLADPHNVSTRFLLLSLHWH